MAKLELAEETKAGVEEIKEADLLIAVAAPVEAEQLRTAATRAILGLDGSSLGALRTVVAFPGVSGTEPVAKVEMDLEEAQTPDRLRFLPYAMPAGSPAKIPWLPTASIYQALFAMAREMGVSACAVIAS